MFCCNQSLEMLYAITGQHTAVNIQDGADVPHCSRLCADLRGFSGSVDRVPLRRAAGGLLAVFRGREFNKSKRDKGPGS